MSVAQKIRSISENQTIFIAKNHSFYFNYEFYFSTRPYYNRTNRSGYPKTGRVVLRRPSQTG